MTDLNLELSEKKEETIEDSEINNKNKLKAKKNTILFPWWTKIIAYLLSFIFAFISLFFTVIKGIEFGDEKVKKWLSSLTISFLSSIFLTQPIQVLLVSFFFVIVCRKYDESQDYQIDAEDNGESLNYFWKWSMDTLAVNLRAGKWYNGSQPYGMPGYLNDKTSRMLGYATLRQVRVQNRNFSEFKKLLSLGRV